MTRYGRAAQAFHWATAVIVLVAFIYGPGGAEERVYAPATDFDRSLHETLGIAVFVMAAARLAWRAIDTRPDPPAIPRWMGFASRMAQGLLYILVFALPITAISGAWLEGHPLTLLGGARIGPWLAKNHDAGAAIARLHAWLGDAIMWLAGVHALAALYHHFILKDGVLLSMLPWPGPRGTRVSRG